jgi:hypothetical protein
LIDRLEPIRMVTHSVLRSHPSLRTLGFAVQYFPRYVHTTPHPHSVDVVLMSVIIRGRGRHVMGERFGGHHPLRAGS